MRRADRLLELPQEADVHRRTVADRIGGTPQGGERWTLVVGRAAREVAVAPAGEAERIGAPLRTVGGLDVEVVVDGDRRPRGITREGSGDERMPAGLEDLRLAAARADVRRRALGGAAHVALPDGLDGDARDLDELGERRLVLLAARASEPRHLRAREGAVRLSREISRTSSAGLDHRSQASLDPLLPARV